MDWVAIIVNNKSHSMLDVIFQTPLPPLRFKIPESGNIDDINVGPFFWILTVKCQKRPLFSHSLLPLIQRRTGQHCCIRKQLSSRAGNFGLSKSEIVFYFGFWVIALLVIWTGSAQLNFNAWDVSSLSQFGTSEDALIFSSISRFCFGSFEVMKSIWWFFEMVFFFSYSNFKNPLVDFCINRHC